MKMDIEKENNLIQEAFEIEADEIGFCLDQKWGDYENPYENSDTALAFNLFKKGWQAAKAQAEIQINTLDEMLLNQGEALAQAKAVPEWINASDRLPEEGEDVLVHHYGHIVQATRDKKYSSEIHNN